MAKHKARTSRSVVGTVLVTAVAALSLTLVGPSADADLLPPVAPGKQVTAKNADVTAICKMTVQAVNASTGQVSIRLAAQAKSTNFLAGSTHAYTQVFCTVYDENFNVVATNNPFRNGATVPNTATQSAVPYSSQYFLCGQGFVKLNNGNQSFTPVVCA